MSTPVHPKELPEDIFKHPLRSVPEFVDRLSAFLGGNRIYRGQGCSCWDLRPKAGRPEFLSPQSTHEYLNPLYAQDLNDFAIWKRAAIAVDKSLPKWDLQCLAYAQHYGLATRLLDWTENPLVALFFAVDTEPDNEGVVYGYQPGTSALKDEHVLSEGVFSIHLYRPRPFDRRIQAQHGVFTYHPRPGAPFQVSQPYTLVPIEGHEDDFRESLQSWANPLRDLTAFLIPAASKRGMMAQLKSLGITRKALFPDLGNR